MHIRTLAVIVALLVGVTASFFVRGREHPVVATHALAGAVDGQDVRTAPSNGRRTARDHEPLMQEEGRERAAIIGLMMLLGAHHGR